MKNGGSLRIEMLLCGFEKVLNVLIRFPTNSSGHKLRNFNIDAARKDTVPHSQSGVLLSGY
jgi:hypothetical protein